MTVDAVRRPRIGSSSAKLMRGKSAPLLVVVVAAAVDVVVVVVVVVVDFQIR